MTTIYGITHAGHNINRYMSSIRLLTTCHSYKFVELTLSYNLMFLKLQLSISIVTIGCFYSYSEVFL